MDFIILKSDGSLQKQSLTRYIQQGSHGVDEIFIGWANATSSHILQAVFTLPNKLTNTELGTFESDYEYEPGETINGWVITLTENQTRYNGLLMVSARIILNGIVQVAYPFALCINETGVRPETDSGVTLEQLDSYLLNIQTLITGAVQQNTDATLSNTSENPVQNKVITSALENFKKDSYKKVDTTEYPTLQDFLDSEGEEGYLYLYPIDPSDEDAGFYRYIWENDAWVSLGTTVIDLSNMVTTDTNQTITSAKTFNNDIYISNQNAATSKEIYFVNNTSSPRIRSNAYVLEVNANWCPRSNNSYNLGNSSANWKDLYLYNSIIFPLWTIKDLGDGDLAFTYNNSNKFYIRNGYALAQTVRPISHNAYDLGTANYAWKDAYFKGRIRFYDSAETPHQWGIGSRDNYYFGIFDSSNTIFYFNPAGTAFARKIQPANNNVYDLGVSSSQWKDLYLAGNLSDSSASRTVGGLCGKTGAPTVSSNTTELPYDTLSELSLSANTTINLQTAPTGCYPEYKAIITASASITLTFNGVSNFLTNDEDNVVITNGTNTTVALASGTTVEISIVNGKGVAINFGA